MSFRARVIIITAAVAAVILGTGFLVFHVSHSASVAACRIALEDYYAKYQAGADPPKTMPAGCAGLSRQQLERVLGQVMQHEMKVEMGKVFGS